MTPTASFTSYTANAFAADQQRELADTARRLVARGCTNAYLDTFDFQALPFYRKEGYGLYGTLEEFPPGHRRYYLSKALGGG